MILAGGRARSLLSCALLLGAVLAGCGRSDPIVVIAVHPKKPHLLYVATNDYIFKSKDEGRTWKNISKGMTHSRVISLAIDPTYPATVYAGTKGDAVFKSHDGGQHWRSKRTGLDSVTISSVVTQFVFDPAESRRLFVATTMGIRESRDGGDTWYKRMQGMKEVLMVVTLTLDPTTPTIMYAGTSGGVYKSIDRAKTWEKANNGLIPADLVKSSRALGVTVVSVDPHGTGIVYAATLSGLYKSVDAAESWSRIGESLPDQMIIRMVLDRAQPETLSVATRQGVYKSSDGGQTWEAKNTGFQSLNIRSLVQSEVDPKTWYAGTNGTGLYRSRDAGETWERMPAVEEERAGD